MTTGFSVARRRMVQEQLIAGGITDKAVLAAMRKTPRHLFVPRLLQHRAHQASALPIGFGQTISQPFTVALMTSLLELRGGEKVLEIGTGSGYQAAVLSCLARQIISVERIRPLASRAALVLERIDCRNVQVLAQDGLDGFADQAPFEAIMVTACAPTLPPLLAGQLAEGGRLLIPVNKGREQILYRYRRQGEELVVEQSVSCRFVPLLPGLSEGDEAGPSSAGSDEAAPGNRVSAQEGT